MTARTERLRRDSLDAVPSISSERAAITTAFYREEQGRHSVPGLDRAWRALRKAPRARPPARQGAG